MGGERIGPPGLSDDELEARAREELHRGVEQRRNLFLSFAYEDINDVNLLRGQARNENSDLEFNDWSVREPFDSDRAAYIKQRIGERISQASVTVVYVSEATATSSWVAWEVEESIRRGKHVIATHKGDQPPSKVPGAITQNHIRLVPWSDLAEALKKLK